MCAAFAGKADDAWSNLSAGPPPAGEHVLVVGDSHTWLTPPYPEDTWEVDARPGRDSAEALRVLRRRLRGRHDEVVFDIATNDLEDPREFGRRLDGVWQEVGARRDLTLVKTWLPCCSPVASDPVNDEIDRFAELHPQRVAVVAWDEVARAHPEWNADGIHYTREGYAKRREMVRCGVRGERPAAGCDDGA